MVLEYNGNGHRRQLVKSKSGLVRPYPRNEFWEIVKSYGIRTVFNSDCHDPDFLYDDVMKEAEAAYKKIGTNHTDFIEIK